MGERQAAQLFGWSLGGDALTHDEGVEAGSIEEIFDSEFRRRFTELITKTAQRNKTTHYNWPRR